MMLKGRSRSYIAGFIIQVLLGVMLTLLGAASLLGLAPDPDEKTAQTMPPAETMRLIAAGQLATGLLLIIPWTSSLGVLLATGFWGGTICFHLVRGEPYFGQSGLLILTWVGGYLRNPGLLASFKG
jgi:hypothetical protein